MASQLRLVFSLFSRIICLGYAVLAAFSIPEARQYLKQDVVASGKTIYMPLIICKPATMDVAGTTVSFDAEDVAGCHTMSFLANACAMSLIFSIAAMMIFFLADLWARRGKSRVPGAVVGMGLFLIFILLQTAIVAWALGSESRFWETYYEDVFKEVYEGMNDAKSPYSYSEIKMHGDTYMILATGAAAILCSILLALETMMNFCCPISSTNRTNEIMTSSTKTAQTNQTAAMMPSSSTASWDMEEQPTTATSNIDDFDSNPFGASSSRSGPAWSSL